MDERDGTPIILELASAHATERQEAKEAVWARAGQVSMSGQPRGLRAGHRPANTVHHDPRGRSPHLRILGKHHLGSRNRSAALGDAGNNVK